jgi:hypothetical protein
MSLILAVILATAPLGAVAAVVTDLAATAAFETHEEHASPTIGPQQGSSICPDAGCPVEAHAAACAAQTTHCKSAPHLVAAAVVGLDRTDGAVLWRFEDEVGTGAGPDLDLPPPRF